MKVDELFTKGYFKNSELLKRSIFWNFTLSFTMVACIAGLVYISARRQNVPYIVEVDSKTGEITNTKVLDNTYKNNSLKEKQVDYFLSKIIIAVRSIPTDKNFYQKNIDSVQSFFTRESGEQLKKSLEKQPDANTLIQMVYCFLRDFPATLKNKEFKLIVFNDIEEKV